jgi:hypothetical protein
MRGFFVLQYRLFWQSTPSRNDGQTRNGHLCRNKMSLDWINLAQDRGRWLRFVNAVVPCFGFRRMMALLPSLSTAALCTWRAHHPSLLHSRFLLPSGDERRLLTHAYRLRSQTSIRQQPKLRLASCFLNSRSGLEIVFGPTGINDEALTLLSYWVRLRLLTSCTTDALRATIWFPPRCWDW